MSKLQIDWFSCFIIQCSSTPNPKNNSFAKASLLTKDPMVEQIIKEDLFNSQTTFLTIWQDRHTFLSTIASARYIQESSWKSVSAKKKIISLRFISSCLRWGKWAKKNNNYWLTCKHCCNNILLRRKKWILSRNWSFQTAKGTILRCISSASFSLSPISAYLNLFLFQPKRPFFQSLSPN